MLALKSGALDAGEWIGPWLDMALGLHEAASFYYYPGFHEPGTAQAVGINKSVWESFDASDRRVIEAVSIYAQSLAECNASPGARSAVSGHATAAPPSSMMKWRRLVSSMGSPPQGVRVAHYHSIAGERFEHHSKIGRRMAEMGQNAKNSR